jgi:hypothetical protein
MPLVAEQELMVIWRTDVLCNGLMALEVLVSASANVAVGGSWTSAFLLATMAVATSVKLTKCISA